jgi:hypothetical protein
MTLERFAFEGHSMRRRSVLALLASPAMLQQFTARAADDRPNVFRLAVLVALPQGPGYRAFNERLRQLGYEEGRNLHTDQVDWFGSRPTSDEPGGIVIYGGGRARGPAQPSDSGGGTEPRAATHPGGATYNQPDGIVISGGGRSR